MPSIKTVKKFIFDLLFPIYCLGCQKEGFWLCEDCLKKVKLNPRQVCPLCKKKTYFGEFCENCQVTSSLRGIVVAAPYHDKLLQIAIRTLKYKFAEELSEPLGKILVNALTNTIFKNSTPENTVLIPVPLHRRRIRWRGFNQAELLAKQIGKKFNFPVLNNVVGRAKNTATQTELNFIDRRLNIRNAFVLKNAAAIHNKNIFLIDDVSTTGATLEECGRVLAAAKPKEIWGVVLARG